MRMMNRTPQSRQSHRSGFTLVEMLVAVALVLLMMSLFSYVFQLASESVKAQRVIAENDQKVRALTGIIRADVAKRTMRRVQPFFPLEDAENSPTTFGNRRGAFYISTNDPNSGSDDILYLTIDSTQTQKDLSTDPYFGHSEQLVDRSATPDPTTLTGSPNQPEVDDGYLIANNTSSSSAAEVCYFIRNGNLYRRVLLIRDALSIGGRQLTDQPRNTDDQDFFSGYNNVGDYDGQFETVSDGTTDDFWTYFDNSAYAENQGDLTTPAPDGLDDFSARFLGVSALSNDEETVTFGRPQYRFGFDTTTGRSREHLSLGGLFMGRFLHAETSATNFNYPQQHSLQEGSTSRLEGPVGIPNGNPLDMNITLSLFNRYGIIPEFDEESDPALAGRGGARAFEDLLLANVHEMRIELWDERLGRYAVPGHSSESGGVEGDYHIGRVLNTDTGPLGVNRAFDTWHRLISGLDYDASGTIDADENIAQEPPFIPYVFYPPFEDGSTPHQLPGTEDLGPTPVGTSATVVYPYWEPGVEYTPGNIVFAPWSDTGGDGAFDYSEVDSVAAFQIAYLCLDATDDLVVVDADAIATSGAAGSVDFDSQITPGRTFTDNEITWQVVDNRRPLTAIRLTIQFENQQAGEMRQLSLELSLQD